MKYVLTLTFIIILISCHKDEIVLSTEADYINLSNYFPLKIENDWCYESDGIGEWAIVERTIVDTIRDNDGHLLFKAKWGVKNYPNDEYAAEYYYWGELGLYKYYCGIEDTCKDQSGEDLPPIYNLPIKSPSYESEIWNR